MQTPTAEGTIVRTLFPVWQQTERMPKEISYYMEDSEHGLYAVVNPLSVNEDRTPYAYTYAVMAKDSEGNWKRFRCWLDSGKKHKVSLQEGQAICEAAMNEFIASIEE